MVEDKVFCILGPFTFLQSNKISEMLGKNVVISNIADHQPATLLKIRFLCRRLWRFIVWWIVSNYKTCYIFGYCLGKIWIMHNLHTAQGVQNEQNNYNSI